MDVDATLQEYQIQLEQVELALKSDPENEELTKLKNDLLEVIILTEELIAEEKGTEDAKKNDEAKKKPLINWKSGQKCMAIWRVDGKYYPGTLDQVLEDGTCTVIFDDKFNNEISQVSQLLPYDSEAAANSKRNLSNNKSASQVGNKKAFTKKELELKLREAKKRKKEKFAAKLKVMDEISEKQKNKWNSFNTKLSGRTWKGVVKKNKFVVPDDHESKIGVGTNSLTNRLVSANGTIVASSSSASASAALVSSAKAARQSSKTSSSRY